jgi:hypothetical protein
VSRLVRLRVFRTLLPAAVCSAACNFGTLAPTAPQGHWPGAGPNFLDAQLSECPSAAALAGVSEIPITFTGGITADPLVCTAEAGSADLTRKQERIYQALILIKRLQFDRPLPWTNDTLWDWFVGAVHQIQVSDQDKLSGGGNYARIIFLNLPHQPDANLAWDHNSSWLLGMVHEGRHNDFGPHTCGTTDHTPEELGANGVVYYLEQWLGLYATPDTFPVEYRPYQLFNACMMRNTSFCVKENAVCHW